MQIAEQKMRFVRKLFAHPLLSFVSFCSYGAQPQSFRGQNQQKEKKIAEVKERKGKERAVARTNSLRQFERHASPRRFLCKQRVELNR